MSGETRQELRDENTMLAFGLFVAGLALVQSPSAARYVVAYVLVFSLGLMLGRRP